MDHAELLERVASSRAELERLVEAVPATDLDRPFGDGWSVKQHVAHIAAWEASLVALLRRQSRPAAMGVPDDIWAAHEIDAVNASIANAAAPETFESVLQRFHAIHGEVLTELKKLTDADLARPYSDFDTNPAYATEPIEGHLGFDTFDHYEEHIGWLRAGLAPAS